MSEPSPKKQVVLHAGLPKTGTTYLQRCFADNAAWLERRGVAYPQLGREHEHGHHNLAFALRGMPTRAVDYGGRAPAELIRQAVDVAQPRVLLSSEAFSAIDGPGIAALRDGLTDCDVVVALFVRRRSRRCVSAWQERIKLGEATSLLEYVAEELLGSGARGFRFEQVLTAIHAAFGGAAMRVAVYDHVVEDGLDLFDFFAGEVLGLEVDDDVVGRGQTDNRAIPPAQLEVVRAVHAVAAARAARPPELGMLLQHLEQDAHAAALVQRVGEVFEQHGERIDLRALDGEWLDRDRHVRAALGDAILNAADDVELFRPAPSRDVRALRPTVLYQQIPPAAFAEIYDRLPPS